MMCKQVTVNQRSRLGLEQPGIAQASLVQLENPGEFSSLNQLNLILVSVVVSGPADRISAPRCRR